MKTRSLFRTSLALGALASTFLLPTPLLAAPPVTQLRAALTVKAQREGYIRELRGGNGSLDAVQTVIRRFTPLRRKGPTISLVAAVHIGEKSYYQSLQQFLDKQDVVFYEGVRPSRTSAKSRSVQVARSRADRAPRPPIGIQKKMSDALQLQFQLDGIRYNRPHFRNSDLDWDTLSALAIKAGPDTRKLLAGLENSVAGGPGITRNDQIVDRMLTLSASTPLLAAILRRLLMQVLVNSDNTRALPGTATAQSGPLASANKLDFILVNERNKVVLADIKALLDTSQRNLPHPVRSIAVFYGAAHMKDIERHLVSDLGYRSVEAQWLTAIRAAH